MKHLLIFTALLLWNPYPSSAGECAFSQGPRQMSLEHIFYMGKGIFKAVHESCSADCMKFNESRYKNWQKISEEERAETLAQIADKCTDLFSDLMQQTPAQRNALDKILDSLVQLSNEKEPALKADLVEGAYQELATLAKTSKDRFLIQAFTKPPFETAQKKDLLETYFMKLMVQQKTAETCSSYANLLDHYAQKSNNNPPVYQKLYDTHRTLNCKTILETYYKNLNKPYAGNTRTHLPVNDALEPLSLDTLKQKIDSFGRKINAPEFAEKLKLEAEKFFRNTTFKDREGKITLQITVSRMGEWGKNRVSTYGLINFNVFNKNQMKTYSIQLDNDLNIGAERCPGVRFVKWF